MGGRGGSCSGHRLAAPRRRAAGAHGRRRGAAHLRVLAHRRLRAGRGHRRERGSERRRGGARRRARRQHGRLDRARPQGAGSGGRAHVPHERGARRAHRGTGRRAPPGAAAAAPSTPGRRSTRVSASPFRRSRSRNSGWSPSRTTCSGSGSCAATSTLQGATSLAEALKEVDRNLVEVRAAPVVVERCRGGEVWHADASRVQPLHQSLLLGMRAPGDRDGWSRSARGPHASSSSRPLSRLNAARYAAEVRPAPGRLGRRPVEVTVVSGADERLAFRAARELDRRPALAALVAPARPGDAADGRRHQGLRHAAPAASGGGGLESAGRRAGRVLRTAAGKALEAAVAAGRLPVSWLPVARRRAPPAPGGARGARGGRARQRPDARAGVLAGDARAGAQLDPPRLRLRRRAPHRGRRRERVGRGRRRAPAAAAVCGASGGAAVGRRRGLDAGGTGRGPSPTGRDPWRPPWPSPATCGLPPGSVARAGDTPRKLVVTTGPLEARERRRRPTREGWSAVGANRMSRSSSGLTATQQRAAADERGTRCQDQEHLTTGERELTALFSRSLQTRKVVLEDALEVRILLVDGVVLDVRQGGADLRGRPVAVDRPVLCVLDDRIDRRLRNGSLRDRRRTSGPAGERWRWRPRT